MRSVKAKQSLPIVLTGVGILLTFSLDRVQGALTIDVTIWDYR
ncbi:MAG: hypothetical protein ACLRU1_00910 [Veillonella parvula]